jgi:hypothetical protein
MSLQVELSLEKATARGAFVGIISYSIHVDEGELPIYIDLNVRMNMQRSLDRSSLGTVGQMLLDYLKGRHDFTTPVAKIGLLARPGRSCVRSAL